MFLFLENKHYYNENTSYKLKDKRSLRSKKKLFHASNKSFHFYKNFPLLSMFKPRSLEL